MVDLGEITTENKLFQLFKKLIPDLVDLNELDEFSPADWYSEKYNVHIEAKCRSQHYDALVLEEKKYKELLNYEKCWYINSSPEGIYGWDIKKLDPIFRDKLMNNSKQFYRNEKVVWKSITELPIQRCHYNFTNKLLK